MRPTIPRGAPAAPEASKHNSQLREMLRPGRARPATAHVARLPAFGQFPYSFKPLIHSTNSLHKTARARPFAHLATCDSPFAIDWHGRPRYSRIMLRCVSGGIWRRRTVGRVARLRNSTGRPGPPAAGNREVVSAALEDAPRCPNSNLGFETRSVTHRADCVPVVEFRPRASAAAAAREEITVRGWLSRRAGHSGRFGGANSARGCPQLKFNAIFERKLELFRRMGHMVL